MPQGLINSQPADLFLDLLSFTVRRTSKIQDCRKDGVLDVHNLLNTYGYYYMYHIIDDTKYSLKYDIFINLNV